MKIFLDSVWNQRGGIFVLLAGIIVLAVVLRYLAFIFRWGRFREMPVKPESAVGYVVAQFFANLINDFRHFLALILVLIFAGALAVGLIVSPHDVPGLTGALQAVTSTLGGLIGSIIGYYFGESAVKRTQSDAERATPAGPAIQSPQSTEGDDAPPITTARPPPNGS